MLDRNQVSNIQTALIDVNEQFRHNVAHQEEVNTSFQSKLDNVFTENSHNNPSYHKDGYSADEKNQHNSPHNGSQSIKSEMVHDSRAAKLLMNLANETTPILSRV